MSADRVLDSDVSNPSSPREPYSSPVQENSSPLTSPQKEVLSSVEGSSSQESSQSLSPTSPLKRKRRSAGQASRKTLQSKLRRLSDSSGHESLPSAHTPEDVANQATADHLDAVVERLGGSDDLNEEAANVSEGEPNSYPGDQAVAEDNVGSDSDDSGPSQPSGTDSSCVSSSPYSSGCIASSTNSISSSSSGSECGDSDEISVESINPLYVDSDVSASEGLLEVFKLFVEENWTKKSLDKSVRMLKKLLPQPNEMPANGKAALTLLESMTVKYTDCEFLFCNNCSQLLQEGNVSCADCDNSAVGKFYSFPIDDQLRHMFEQRKLAEVIDYYRDNCKSKPGFISDIRDGTEYMKVRQHLTNLYDLILLWCTDGVSLANSSKEELWPILATICEVPPRLRSSYMLVCGAFVAKTKPDMNVFLKPFRDSLVRLWEHGMSWVHPNTKVNHVSKVIAPVLSADAPAKAMCLVCKNYNYKYGCNICEQKTRRLEEPEPIVVDPDRRVIPKRRFLYQDGQQAQLRNGIRMDAQGRLAERRGQPRKGVLGTAVISTIPHLDRGTCICNEYLHLIALGSTKYFLKKIFFVRGPWYIGDDVIDIDMFIDGIKVPDFITRLPRKLKDFKYWKGSELRAFLLYYSLPLFKQLMPERYYQHWLLFVSAMHILLQDSISEDDLNVAEVMLRSFVRDVGALYGDMCYTYNVHNLLHVTLLVRRWGNLWATSGFIFESFNGFLSSHLHGTKHLGKELINNLKIAQRVAILDNIVNADKFSKRWEPKQYGTELLGKPLKFDSLSDEERAAVLSVNLGMTVLLYKRAKLGHFIYSTKHYDSDKRRGNSYVQFNHSGSCSFGQIIGFLKSDVCGSKCLVEVYKIKQPDLLYHEESGFVLRNLVPVEASGQYIVISVENITTKVLKVGKFFAIRPNSYEVNL